MDNKQSSKFKMYQAVAKVCQTNATDIATNPAFKAEADEFVALIPEIRRVNGLIGDDLKPVAITKNQAKDAMVESALDMAKNIKAVGLINKDENLKSIGDVTKSGLSAGKEEDILQRCQRIAKKARTILPALNDRGMDSNLLDELDSLIEDFETKKPEPQSIKKEKTTLIAQLGKLFDRGDDLLELMLLTLPNFKRSNPTFFERFENASVMETPVSKTTKARFLPKDLATNELLTNFSVECPTLGFKAFINGVSNPALEIKNHADVQLIFTKEGYETVVLEHEKITKGQINNFEVKMQAVAAT